MSSPETPDAGHHRPVAAFDFDGTLARRDTLLGFLVQATSTSRVAMAMAAESRALASDRDQGKVRVLRRLLAGDDPERLTRLGHDYAVGLGHVLRPEMTERVRWHRTEGHELVIVSASLAYYLEPLAHTLGFDHVIAVEFEVGADDRLTGNLAGPNVRGPEKASRLTAWFGERPATELWAYGDSSGDDELLGMATHPRWIGRRAKRNA